VERCKLTPPAAPLPSFQPVEAGAGPAFRTAVELNTFPANMIGRIGRLPKRWSSIPSTRPPTGSSDSSTSGGVGMRRDRAFAALDTRFDERAFDLVRIVINPAFCRLRSEPAFQTLLARLGQPTPTSPPGAVRVKAMAHGSPALRIDEVSPA
jgi:hypothetical protein